MSKFPLDVLQKAVFPFTDTTDPDVILGATFGEDISLTRVGNDILASHVDPIIGAIENIGWLAVHVASNDVATSGIPPRWLLILVLVPRREDEFLLTQIMRDARRAANEIGASIIGGHAGYSAGLSRPLVAVAALGTASGRQPVLTGGAQVGDYLLVTKGIALEGTAILAHDFVDIAQERGLDENDLATACQLMAEISVVPEALAIANAGATALHDATRGGVLEALLEIANLSQVTIEIEADQLPSRPIVSRFAEAFPFDPLRMISSGTLVATIPPRQVKATRQALDDLEVPYAFAGHVKKGTGVTISQDGDNHHYTKIRCEEDELARIWSLYPR
jgi:hydrogenase maturation factor